jgi:hypothetical protein
MAKAMSKPNNKAQRLFVELNVWKRIDDTTLIRYRCFRVIPDHVFFVKSSDFYYYPLDEKQITEREHYFLDSLFQDALEELPEEVYETLEEAIQMHDEAFRDR